MAAHHELRRACNRCLEPRDPHEFVGYGGKHCRNYCKRCDGKDAVARYARNPELMRQKAQQKRQTKRVWYRQMYYPVCELSCKGTLGRRQ